MKNFSYKLLNLKKNVVETLVITKTLGIICVFCGINVVKEQTFFNSNNFENSAISLPIVNVCK